MSEKNNSFDDFFSNFGGMFGGMLGGIFSSNDEIDWEKLKTKGNVTEVTIEENGIKTTTKTFTGSKGNKITVVSSSPIVNEKEMKIKEKQQQLDKAVETQDYELAAILKKEIQNLKDSKA